MKEKISSYFELEQLNTNMKREMLAGFTTFISMAVSYTHLHTDVGSASGDMADYFFVEKTLQDALGSIPAEKIIPLNAIIDYDETKEKVLKVLDDNGIAHQ